MGVINKIPTNHVYSQANRDFDFDLLAGNTARPDFYTNINDNTEIILPASTTSIAVARIGSTYYLNKSNAILDINASGRNGLDVGTVAASKVYYLFGIASSGTTFDLVASLQSPINGPVGFSQWTYLGAFVTTSAAKLEYFYSSGGIYIGDGGMPQTASVSTTGTTSAVLSPYPSTAHYHYGEIIVGGTSAGNRGAVTSVNSTSSVGLECYSQVSGVTNVFFGRFPALNGSTVYLYVNNVNVTVKYQPYGWIEIPMDYL